MEYGNGKIRLIIDSDFENVPLIGSAIRNLCSLIPFSDIESDQVELCLVEAVNNCIEHAYGKQKGHDVEVIVSLNQDGIVLEICDTGKAMDQSRLENIDMPFQEIDIEDLDSIPEEGRGLPIMKAVMDAMSYKTENRKNCLSMIKNTGSR